MHLTKMAEEPLTMEKSGIRAWSMIKKNYQSKKMPGQFTTLHQGTLLSTCSEWLRSSRTKIWSQLVWQTSGFRTWEIAIGFWPLSFDELWKNLCLLRLFWNLSLYNTFKFWQESSWLWRRRRNHKRWVCDARPQKSLPPENARKLNTSINISMFFLNT